MTAFQVAPEFAPLLAHYRLESLAATPDIVFGLTPNLTLAYFNPAWFCFAAENGGEPQIRENWPLGRSLLDAIPANLRPFFAEHYARVLCERRPWTHDYECSSATIYREFTMKVLPLGDAEGLLVVNALRRALPHERIAAAAVETHYRNADGLILQCCHCRRVRQVGTEERWDWVPAWVARIPDETSHGLCETCFAYYYRSNENYRDPPQFFSTAETPRR